MSLKYGTDAVTDVKYRVNSTDNIVTVIQDADGTVYYARPGRLVIDTPTGVTAMTVTRTGGLEPTESTGVLSNNATIYHGDVLEVRPTMDPRYQATYPASSTMDFISTNSFVASSVLQISTVGYNVTIPDSEYATVTYQYYTPGASAATTGSTLDTTVTAWGNTKFTYTWTAAAYYKIIAGSTTATLTITHDTTIGFPVLAEKKRTITVSNPDKLARMYIYANGSVVASSSDYSTPSLAASVFSGYGITYGVGSYRYDSNAVWYENASGSYPAADNETAINATFKAHVFNFATYDCGTITYYNGSTAITQGTVAGYNVYTYKLTAKNNGYFYYNNAYTRTITGTVDSRPANQSSTWKPSLAEQNIYYKLTLKSYRRGAVYYAPSGKFTQVVNNSPLATHSYETYVLSGSTVKSYADYVNTADQTAGTLTNYYGDAGDTYTSSSSACSTIITSNTTVTYSGTLLSRPVYIYPKYGSNVLNGNYQYYETNGSLKTYTWSGSSGALTTTYVSIPRVWRGSYITATYGISSDNYSYTYVSGFDSRGPSTNTTTYTLCASYSFYTSTGTSGTSTTISRMYVGSAGYYVINGKVGSSQFTLTYPSTSYTYSGYTLSATYSYPNPNTLLVTASFSGLSASTKTLTIKVYSVPKPTIMMDSDWSGGTNQVIAYVSNPDEKNLRLNYQLSCTYYNPSTGSLATMTGSSATMTVSSRSSSVTPIYSNFSSAVPSGSTIYSYSITCSFTNTAVGYTGQSITTTYERPVVYMQRLLETEDADNGGWIHVYIDSSYGGPSQTPTSYGTGYQDHILDYGKNLDGTLWFTGNYEGFTQTYTCVGQMDLDLSEYGYDTYDVWLVDQDPDAFRLTRNYIGDQLTIYEYIASLTA